MSIQTTALEIDVLTQSPEIPEPVALKTGAGLIPINPMLFPHNWDTEIALETRWMTDVTRSFSGSRSESLILASRPSRKLSAKILGGTREECFAILQACIAYSKQLGAPVPLYPDTVRVTGVSGNRIEGDFSRKRFFVGGRVVFMPTTPVKPAQSDNSCVLAKIREITPTSMLVDFEPLATRAVTTADDVIPCMDAELVEKSSGISLTDSVYTLNITWDEIDGVSTLPGIWPAVQPGNADVALPICTVLDNLPLFPLEIDWSDGVDIDVTRTIDAGSLGRTSVQQPIGDTFFTFTLRVMGYNREVSWKILRFFDMVRARAASFYFIPPQRFWTLGGFASTSACTINAVGATAHISHFKRAVFTRSDGTMVTRQITSFTDLGSSFQIALTPALPDTSFIDIQPILECSLDQDAIQERWSTTTVLPSIELVIREERDPGPVSLVGTLEYRPNQTATPFSTIAGLNLFLRAGAGMVSYDGKESVPFPGRGSGQYAHFRFGGVQYWNDLVSSYPPRDSSKVPPLRRFKSTVGVNDISTSARAQPILFLEQRFNNGQPAIVNPSFDYETQLDSTIPISDRWLWTPDGWTIFFCFTPEYLDPSGVAPFTRQAFRVDGAEVAVHLVFDSASATGLNRSALTIQESGGPLVTHAFTQFLYQGEFPSLFVLRWDPVTSKMHAWINGKQAFASAVSYNIPILSTVTFSRWFDGFRVSPISLSPAYIRAAFGTVGCANLVASYGRALTALEMDTVCRSIASMYIADIKTPVIY